MNNFNSTDIDSEKNAELDLDRQSLACKCIQQCIIWIEFKDCTDVCIAARLLEPTKL